MQTTTRNELTAGGRTALPIALSQAAFDARHTAEGQRSAIADLVAVTVRAWGFDVEGRYATSSRKSA